jgi:hypothetical protein
MTNSQIFKSLVDEYQLEVNGIKFWTPYWREGERLPETDHAKPGAGPYKGKGSPKLIKDYLHDHPPKIHMVNGEAYRCYMRQELHLGVECSGFIYYVLDQFLQKKNDVKLQDNLFKSRQDLLDDFDRFGSAHKPEVTRGYLENLPEQVSLSQIQEFWGNDPVRLAGVKILTNEAGNISFAEVNDLRPGDQIAMTGHDEVEHSLLVVGIDDGLITYAHSGGTHGKPDYYGGVEYGHIRKSDLEKSIHEHEWLGNGKLILETHNFSDKPLRRLRVLDGPAGS